MSLSNRSNNRSAVLLATKNQARLEISAALKQYLDYLHDIENPAATLNGTMRLDERGIGQNPNASHVLEALEQLESELKHDPRLGNGGLEILKGYIPLFPNTEEVMVDIQFSQIPIEKDLDAYFRRTNQLIKEESSCQTTPTGVSREDMASRFPRTEEELRKIWSQVSIVNNFVEHLNFTVLSDLANTREHWMWTGNREYFSHLDDVGARLWSDRHDNPHVSRRDKE